MTTTGAAQRSDAHSLAGAPSEAGAPSPHHPVVTHRGSFAHATCSTCGWVGAARRSIGRVELDAEAHQLLGPDA